jgi:septal ring factor EnvC (AmiA/AmiB activator)
MGSEKQVIGNEHQNLEMKRKRLESRRNSIQEKLTQIATAVEGVTADTTELVAGQAMHNLISDLDSSQDSEKKAFAATIETHYQTTGEAPNPRFLYTNLSSEQVTKILQGFEDMKAALEDELTVVQSELSELSDLT